VVDIDEPIEGCECEERPACAEEDIGTGPKVFIDWEPDVPEKAGGEREDSCDKKTVQAHTASDASG